MSNIDPSKPTYGKAYTSEVRTNFQFAKTEIEALQYALSVGPVTSFNTRVGTVTLTSTDVTNALGYNPATGGQYLLLTGGTVTGPSVFSGSGVGLQVTNRMQSAGLDFTGTVLSTIATADTNLDLKVGGTGGIFRVLNGNNVNLFQVSGQGTPVNRVSIVGTATATPPSISATGTDTNIDLSLLGKGTGIINVGSRMTSRSINLAPTPTDWTGLGGAAATRSTLYSLQTVTGASIAGPNYNYIAITDSVDANGGVGNCNGLKVNLQTIAGATGQRQTLVAELFQTAAAPAGFGPLIALNGYTDMRFNAGGVAGNPSGGVFGFNTMATINTNATYCMQCIGGEIDIAVINSTGVFNKVGLYIASLTADAYSADGEDSYLSLVAQSNGIGFRNGISLGNWTSGTAFVSTGITSLLRYFTPVNLSGTPANMRLYDGANFVEANIEHWAFASPNFAVHGSNYVAGAIQAGNGMLTPVANGLAIDSSGSVGTGTPTIAAGGSGYIAGGILYAAGGVFRIAAASSGVVTSVTVLKQPIAVSNALPTNPVATTVARITKTGDGAGCTLNLSWAAGTTVNVGTTDATIIAVGRTASTTTIAGKLRTATLFANAANDAAAASAGVGVGELYRNGSVVMQRAA